MNYSNSIFFKIKYKLRQYYEAYVLKKPESILALEFIKNDKIKDFRHSYNLKDSPTIFDCGAFKGEWTIKMLEKYKHLNPTFYCFEVVNDYVIYLNKIFSDNPNVNIFPFGLGFGNHKITFQISDIATSVYLSGSSHNLQEGNIVDFSSFVIENSIANIDLLKMNIEGGEYELLETIIDSGFVINCDNIQIQFHNYGQWSIERRNKIKTSLSSTHFLTYDYEWTFENWKRKV